MDQSQCNRWVHLLSEILLKALKAPGELPERNHLKVKHLTEQCENLLLDGTEGLIERPQDSERQKSCYSSKNS